MGDAVDISITFRIGPSSTVMFVATVLWVRLVVSHLRQMQFISEARRTDDPVPLASCVISGAVELWLADRALALTRA